MKKIILLFITLLTINFTFAQDYSIEELNVIQNLFGVQKKAVFEENMDLTDANSEIFWKLYNQYEIERKKIGQDKMEILKGFSEKGGALTNDQADEIIGKSGKIRTSEHSLIMKYVKHIRKETSPIVAAQFYQIENFILDGVRFTLLNNIEFVHKKE